jgi:hypothetical protein
VNILKTKFNILFVLIQVVTISAQLLSLYPENFDLLVTNVFNLCSAVDDMKKNAWKKFGADHPVSINHSTT